MSHVFPRFANIEFPVAVKGDGPYIIDREGNRYLDACGGAGISCLGHSEPAVIKAIQDQVAKLEFAYTMFYTNEPAELLADDLVSDAPAGLTRVFYGCGGSEQIDGTLKMARQYFVDTGRPTADSLYRPASELSRRHAGQLERGRPFQTSRNLHAAARRRRTHLALLRLSRTARRRDRDGVWPARRR